MGKSFGFVFGFVTIAWCAALQYRESCHEPTAILTSANFSTYAPLQIQCPPKSQWVRPAYGLSEDETVWVQGRRAKVLQGLTSYLERLHLEDFDLDEYLKRLGQNPTDIPTIGMAISGGGWSSSLTGTGALRAFDDRFPPAVEQRTGGLLQSMMYLSGLSGGSWPLMSLATYNYPTIDEMVAHWHTNLSPSDSTNDSAYRATPSTMVQQLVPKFEAGYNVSYLELLGRGFSYEFVAGPEGGMATLVSNIAELSNFKNHNMPFPIWQAAELASNAPAFEGIQYPFWNSTLYEWSPFELGAWDGPTAFFPTKYLGTKMANGTPAADDSCIVGFDRASYMLALAADATNFWWIGDLSNGTLGSFAKRDLSSDTTLQRRTSSSFFSYPLADLKELEMEFQQTFNYTNLEGMYVSLPNPFASTSSTSATSNPPENLTLVDQSEVDQALPLWSQIQPARNLDFIVAWDNDEDTRPYGWNNGTSPHGTYVYATNRNIPFPIVPPAATFVNRNFTSKPTFFGCNANLTNTNDTTSPILLYLPNAPYSSFTNYSWLQETFTAQQMSVILTNGFNYVTQGNGTLDPEWPECLGCAAIDRSLARVGIERSAQCQRCMDKWCWDGIEDDSDPGVVDLPLALDPGLSYVAWNRSTPEAGPVWGEVTK